MDIQDKVAIVTGSSEGIGLALAKELSKRGAKVVLSARHPKTLQEAKAQVPRSIAIVADMTRPDDVETLIKQAKDLCGRVDILVNNAGQGLRETIEKIDIDDYKHVFELNVIGPLRAMQTVIPVMQEQGGGVIMNISSQVTKSYIPGLAGYSSTKYALNSLSLTARAELDGDNIKVCTFYPKMTATAFGENARGEKYVSSLGRPGMTVDTAEEVAEAVADQIESEEAESLMR